eukprot:9014326-Alexandrium_andersonii.AAC.1
MGPPWTKWDSFGEAWKYLYVEVSVTEQFESAWSLWEKEQTKKNTNGAAEAARAAPAAPARDASTGSPA